MVGQSGFRRGKFQSCHLEHLPKTFHCAELLIVECEIGQIVREIARICEHTKKNQSLSGTNFYGQPCHHALRRDLNGELLFFCRKKNAPKTAYFSHFHAVLF